MAFQAPPGFPPERELFFGAAGTGKSKSVHSIATRLAQSGSRNKVYVVDTDYSWKRFLAAEGDPGNIVLRETDEWPAFVSAIQNANKVGMQGDWVCIDHIGVAWEMAQNAYIERAYGKDPIDFLIDARSKMKKSAGMGAALSGMGDWPFIKRMYRACMNELIAQPKLHVIGITTAEKIWESDAPDVLATYNQLGGKPGGEKHLDYGFHTVLLHGRNHQQGFWWLTTAKDRGRTELFRQMVGGVSGVDDFTATYLERVGGWSDPTATVPSTVPVAATLVATPPQANGNGGGTETPAEKIARLKAMRTAAGG